MACLGLSFKPDIDDLRESPAVQIVSELAEKTETLMVVEPHINQLPEHLNKPGVELVSFETAKEHADIIVCLVKHTDFVQQADQLDPHKTLDFVNVLNR